MITKIKEITFETNIVEQIKKIEGQNGRKEKF